MYSECLPVTTCDLISHFQNFGPNYVVFTQSEFRDVSNVTAFVCVCLCVCVRARVYQCEQASERERGVWTG